MVAADWLGIGLSIGLVIGCLCFCACYCGLIETRPTSKIMFDRLVAYYGKAFKETPYGAVDAEAANYPREKAEGLSYVRFGPEIRPHDESVNVFAFTKTSSDRTRELMTNHPEQSVRHMRSEMEGLRNLFEADVRADKWMEFEENTGHVIYRPQGIRGDRWVFWFHGGGLVAGFPAISRFILVSLGRGCGANAVGLKYPLAPEASIEEMSQFARDEIVRLINANPQTAVNISDVPVGGGGTPQIILGGDSSGGALAVKVTFDCLNDDRLNIDAVVLCCHQNFKANTPSYEINDQFDYDETASVKAIAPFVAGNVDINGEPTGANNEIPSSFEGDWSRFPPSYIITVGTEVEMDDSFYIAEKIDAAGGRVILDLEPFMFHDYVLMPLPEAIGALARASVFVCDNL